MASWREDVQQALRAIGGMGTLSQIYLSVERLRSPNLPPSWQAIVRRELEYNSSDSLSHQKRFDLFRSVRGIGGGVWALREVAADLAPPPDRVAVSVNRIIRDTKVVRDLKAKYGDCCQLCRNTLSCSDGATYSEGHHVRPLGRDHNGEDVESNILILCPNCHASCDLGFVRLDPAHIEWRGEHRVSGANLDYHNAHLARQDVQ